MASYDEGWIHDRGTYDATVEWEPPDDGSVYPEDKAPGYFYLPHQCGEWKIGSVEDMQAFIADLQRALAAEVSRG